ncbi:MAG: bifunctional metallophosphatase/5'-nucleotidase [Rhodospirillaceae bacterium]
MPTPHPASRRRLRALAAGFALLLAAATAGRAEDLTLTLLHTNDFHARLAPVTAGGSRCRAEDAAARKCFGGVARLATEIAALRASRPHPVLLDAGDRFQGSLFYTYYKSAALKPFFELLNYQAMTLGNHEFDDGPAELARFLDGLTVPVISANVDTAAEPLLAGRIGATLVLPVGGEKLGVIGLTTPATASNAKPGAAVRFTDPVAATRAAVASLHGQGVNRIVVLSHLGVTEDKALAEAVDGVAVIVGGHSHTLLRDGDPRAAGGSPQVVKSPSGKPVLIVQGYFAGVYLGVLQVTLDDDGVPLAWQGEPVLLDDSISEDPAVRGFVSALEKPLAPLLNQPMGISEVALVGERSACRFDECNLGNLIADAIVEQTKSQGTQIAIINGGGIRAGIPAGPVTIGQILEVLPFANTISTFDLGGADLRAALEYGVGRAEHPGNEGTGRFPQVSGLRYRWNAAAPVGQRIVAVEVRQPDGAFAPLDPTAIYHIATHDYLRTRGDGYSVFKEKAINAYDGGALVSEALATFIANHTPVAPALEGRISRTP